MILIIGHQASKTGAPKSLLLFCQWLHENTDERMCFIFGSDGPLLSEFKKLGPVHIWNNPTQQTLSYRILNRIIGLTKLLRLCFLHRVSSKIDVVFSNTCANGEILDFVNKELPNIKIVSRIAELELAIGRINRAGKLGQTFKLSSNFVAVSNSVKLNLIKNHNIPENQIEVCYGALPATNSQMDISSKGRIREMLNISLDKFVILGCGAINWRKGVDIFVELARQIKKHSLDEKYELIWVGGSHSLEIFHELDYRVKKLEISNIKFFSHVNDVESYYLSSDIFFLSSREDPFPLVVIEAASYGLPIFCFEKSGGAEEFVTPQSGRIIPHEEIDEMIKELENLRISSNEMEKLRVGAINRAKDYEINDSASQIYDLLRRNKIAINFH